MALLDSKQVLKPLAGAVHINGFAMPAAATANVSAAITTALATAGDGGIAVPVQASAFTRTVAGGTVFTEGVIGTAPNNLVQVWNSTTKGKLTDATGQNEIYGRITIAGAVYTLSLYSLVAGVETAFTSTAQNIDFEFNYLFSFEHYPFDGAIGVNSKNVQQDVGGGARLRAEKVAVTALNTLAALSVPYVASSQAAPAVNVNGQTFYSVGATPAFTIAGTAITWSAANAGIAGAPLNLSTNDDVTVYYPF